MGQYYTAVLENEDGEVIGRYTYGMKIMEHSWWKNPHCKYINFLLYKQKHRLAWVGDYTEEDDFESEEDYKKFYEFAWHYDEDGCRKPSETTEDEEKLGESLDGKFICNHSKKIYINADSYKKKNDRDGWCIYPISLLTATSNGRGGGDYHDCYPDFELCGSWALDWISVEDEIPEGYDEVMYEFVEERID